MADPHSPRARKSAQEVLAGFGAALIIGFCGLLTATSEAQHPADAGPNAQKKAPETARATSFPPEVEVQSEDYAEARKRFRTKLLREGPSPQNVAMPQPPEGATEVEYPSGGLSLKAWVNRPANDSDLKRPAVLFLHGGFAVGRSDWEMTRPYRDAGFTVLMPTLRGENGQPGTFSLFYDEVGDVLAATEYLAEQPFVDPQRLFVAGHSSGGTLTLLAAMASGRFRAASSFSGSPDQALFVRHAPGPVARNLPFDKSDPRELEVRSPLAYATSFKCPVRIYYGSEEKHFHLTSQRTAMLGKERGLDVEARVVEGGHTSSVPTAMKLSIDFFKQ
jgi:dipeptidyl aminopeptidase/acylaminoacyl peptidase